MKILAAKVIVLLLLLAGCTCEKTTPSSQQSPAPSATTEKISPPNQENLSTPSNAAPQNSVVQQSPTVRQEEPVPDAAPPVLDPAFDSKIPTLGGPPPPLTNGKFVPPLLEGPSTAISPEEAPLKRDGMELPPH